MGLPEWFGRSFAVRLSGATGGGVRFSALAEVRSAFCARSGTNPLLAAIRTGGLMDAAVKKKVAVLGLTAVDHAGHLSSI